MTVRGKKGDDFSSGGKDDNLLQAVVIADSFDTSFAPLSHARPRCLFPLANVPIIDYTLSMLAASGIVQEVFVYCTAHAPRIREHVASRWGAPSPHSAFSVSVVCNENCHSFGDAVRDLDSKGVLRQDFVLLYGDVVANIGLREVMDRHRAAVKADQNATLTFVYKRCAPGHPTRTADREMVVATTPVETEAGVHHRIVFHDRSCSKKINIPLEMFEEHSSLSVRFDLMDPCVAVCSQAVPPLFSDNFDCQTMDDLVRGVIENDLLDNTLYMYEVGGKYAARVFDPMTYSALSMDVLARWTFPIVPDLVRTAEGEKEYTYCRKNIYKGEDIRLDQGSKLTESVIIGHGSSLGENATVSKSCIGRNVKLGKNVRVISCVLFDDVVLGEGTSLENCLVGNGVEIKAGSCVASRCILGDGVVVEANKTVPEGTRLVREEEDDGFGGDDQGDEAAAGSEYGQYALVYVEAGDSDSDSEDGEAVEAKHDSWGGVLAELDDTESSSSEESDISGIEDQMGDLLLNEDAKISVFHNEVLESLQRGAKEGINAENLVLEINSSRHAYAATPQQVVQSVTQSILTIATRGDSDSESFTGVKLLKSVQKSVSGFQALMAKYCSKTISAQVDCLVALAEFCASNAAVEAIAAKVMQVLYDKDLLVEEAILKWYGEEEDEAVEAASPGFSKKFRDRVKPFVDWLEEDEDDSDEESD